MLPPKSLALSVVLVLSIGMPSAQRAAEPAASAEEVRPLLIGATAPTPALLTAEGTKFDLASALSKKPTILILYRGGW